MGHRDVWAWDKVIWLAEGIWSAVSCLAVEYGMLSHGLEMLLLCFMVNASNVSEEPILNVLYLL